MDDERRKFLDQLIAAYKDDLPANMSPVRRPPDKLAHLNPELRNVLGEMSAEDARMLRDALRFYRSASAVAYFLRWFILTVALTLGGLAAFGYHVTTAWRAVWGTPRATP